MKNIEKYTNTKDALEAYNDIDFKNIPFGVWLDCEYEDQSFPTLLEAAECALKAFEERDEYGNLEWVKDRMRQLCVAIKREKHKPVRNCDKYSTYEEAAKREREAGAEAAQICGDIGEMVGREEDRKEKVTDCNRFGNVAKMRAALEQAKRVLHCAIVADILKGEDARKAFNAVTAAISAPPRNCDVLLVKQEALEAIHEDRCYVNNPIDERRLTVEWLFDEAKGE